MHAFKSNGIQVAYIDLNSEHKTKNPILLVHGFASSLTINWVNTLWTKTLYDNGFRVIAVDIRGHGQSDKPHNPTSYHSSLICQDLYNLLDHLEIQQANLMGYSMGARLITLFAAQHPERTQSILLGGLGINILKEDLLPESLAVTMEAPNLAEITDPTHLMFRSFAEKSKNDLKALAACIRGFKQTVSSAQLQALTAPTLISVGTKDTIAGSAEELQKLMKNAHILDIVNRDHNTAVGDKTHKEGVLSFLRTLY